MRNLDDENPLIARPKSLVPIAATLPFLLGGICAILASEATPRVAFFDNPLAFFCICLCPLSLVSAFVPKVFGWDWRAKYFGFSTVHFACASLLGIIPWLCVVLYSRFPLWTRVLLFCVYAGTMVWWCNRFVTHYRRIYADKALRGIMYLEDSDAIYYSQKNDNWLLDKKFKLRQFPSNTSVALSLSLAFLLVPFIRAIKDHVGLPFPHTFLMVGTIPVIMMVLGISVRGYLIFYYYPWKIKKETGKEVYVDMVTKTPGLTVR